VKREDLGVILGLMSDAIAIEVVQPGLKGTVTIIEPDRLERAVARRSAETRATVPTLELSDVVDMEACLKQEAELRCGTTALLLGAVAHALKTVKRMNGAYRDGRYELYSRINIGVTLLADGLHATPVIFDADQKSASEISSELAEYNIRARQAELRPSELTGATFTVVDCSAYRIVALSPMITPPQAGALGAGSIREAPTVRRGALVPGRTSQLALSVDHRIVHPQHGAWFLQEVKAQLEETRV